MPSSIPSSRVPVNSQYIHDAERYLGRITSIIAHTVFFIVLIRFFILEPGVTDGISMEPTMRDNTFFLVEKISPLAIPPQRFDIVQHIEPLKRERSFVKRIIGLPNETVTIKQNAVFIAPPSSRAEPRDPEGVREYRLPEPYLRNDAITTVPYRAQRDFELSENEYFVMGDNRQYSNDSRAYGPVHRSLITGKIFPLITR